MKVRGIFMGALCGSMGVAMLAAFLLDLFAPLIIWMVAVAVVCSFGEEVSE